MHYYGPVLRAVIGVEHFQLAPEVPTTSPASARQFTRTGPIDTVVKQAIPVEQSIPIAGTSNFWFLTSSSG
jgi:hypothetical protein